MGTQDLTGTRSPGGPYAPSPAARLTGRRRDRMERRLFTHWRVFGGPETLPPEARALTGLVVGGADEIEPV